MTRRADIAGMLLLAAGTLMDQAAEFRAEKIDARFERLRDLQSPKRPPQPGDWLAVHAERGQSVADFLNEHRTHSKGKFIELLALGDFTAAQEETVRLTAEYIERFFGLPVKQIDPVPLGRVPAIARRTRFGHEQILTSYVLRELLHPSTDALAAIALTASDLYPDPAWNFVFGQASLTDRVGVWSIFRNGEPRDPLFLRRTLQTAVHELSHMLGIEHCIAYECLMNGSNHQAEKDARPLWLCPLCLAKLCAALHCDPAPRFERLRDFAARHHLRAEERYFAEALTRVR